MHGQAHVAGRHTCQLMMKTMAEYLKKIDMMSFGYFDVSASKVEDFSDVLKSHVGNQYSGEWSMIITFSF